MPFTIESRGTNRDNTFSHDYCINCFKNGTFINIHLSLHQLEMNLLDMAKLHQEISLEEAREAIKILSGLKRWRMNNY